ncbi:MAG TPA: TraB/GumN family protein, partial [Gammaproteobacteria bacterium]|nr:TraB/GumN family protein [Gammaproteobacteria bacterium]
AAYTTLSLPPGKTAMPLDLLLLRVARQGGKEVFGLESIGEQVAVFDGLAISDQTELLEQAVCHYGEFQSEIEKMIGHYVSRDLSAMMRMSMRYRSPLNDRFLDVVLWQRNRRMAERMLPHLQKGGAFIAVGALHLPGVDGVLDLLVKRGYDVQPID